MSEPRLYKVTIGPLTTGSPTSMLLLKAVSPAKVMRYLQEKYIVVSVATQEDCFNLGAQGVEIVELKEKE